MFQAVNLILKVRTTKLKSEKNITVVEPVDFLGIQMNRNPVSAHIAGVQILSTSLRLHKKRGSSRKVANAVTPSFTAKKNRKITINCAKFRSKIVQF
jgi:hypothetical protein